MQDIWERLQKETRPIVLYGITDVAEKTAAILSEKNIKISGVLVSDDFYREREFLGQTVKTMAMLEEELGDFIILLCFGSQREDVMERIRGIAKKHTLLAPDFPVTGEGLFTREYYESRRGEYEELKGLLADEKSKLVLEQVIKYKLSGDPAYIDECSGELTESWTLAPPEDFFMDMGAYTGDTAQLYLSLNPECRQVFAFEPGSRNFRKLSEYAKKEERVTNFKLGMGSKEETVSFPKGSGRGKSTSKFESVQFISADDFLKDPGKYYKEEICGKKSCEFSAEEICESLFIKMDLEGGESAALCGCERVIRQYAPSLLVSAYHRIDDLPDIPRQVLSYNKDYKIYLRKGPGIPAWEINYIFIKQ